MTSPSHHGPHREERDMIAPEETAPVFSWDITTHEEREHGNLFYFSILAVMALLLIFAIWQNNFLFGVFVILATGTILYLSTRRPPVIAFALTENELIINNEVKHPYNHLAYFDVYSYSTNEIELFLVFKKRMRTMLRVPIWRSDKDRIVTFLQTKIPQHPIDPSLLDILSKIVGI
jgi:hypothetical protein